MNDLQLISEVNEDIKHVQKIAEDISVIAINAMRVARQAGDMVIARSAAIEAAYGGIMQPLLHMDTYRPRP